jgi:hypothetical protein
MNDSTKPGYVPPLLRDSKIRKCGVSDTALVLAYAGAETANSTHYITMPRRMKRFDINDEFYVRNTSPSASRKPTWQERLWC